MKTVSATTRTHLNQEVTALTTCWQIVKQDGETLFFTDHDQDVEVGGNTYKSIGAYKRTATVSTDTLSVDNVDVEGITTDLVLPREDMLVGQYDEAEVYFFTTRWDGGPRDEVKIRKGRFGQVQVLPNGTFHVEMRGLMQHLNHTYTDLYTATCLNELGDSICKIPIKVDPVQRSTSYSIGDYVTAPPSGSLHKLLIRDAWFAEAASVAVSSGWYHVTEATITISGVMTAGDALTFNDGTNPSVQLVGDTDFTVGVSASADATALAQAINSSGPAGFTAIDDGAGVITVYHSLGTSASITEDVDSGGVITINNFLNGFMTIGSGPGIGAFNGLQCLEGGTETGEVVQDVDILRSGVSAVSIDNGSCRLDIWGWRTGSTNAASFTVTALDSDLNTIQILYNSGQESIVDDTEWVIRGIREALIPVNTRFLRIKFRAVLTGTPPILQFFDNVYAWVEDLSGSGNILAPYEEWIHQCITAGTTAVTAPRYATGSIGAVTTDGSAAFVSDESWTRGASVISVTPGSSRVFRAEPQEYRAVTGWYDGGLVTFLTGRNAGASMEVKKWTRDGNPTSSSTRIERFPGPVDETVTITAEFTHIDWNRKLAHFQGDNFFFASENLEIFDMDTLSYVKSVDLTVFPDQLDGAAFYGCDPVTGYLVGTHIEGSSYWEYVFDPDTETYVTRIDSAGSGLRPFSERLDYSDSPYCILRHATSGKQVVLNFYDEVRVHDFPSLDYIQTFTDPFGPSANGRPGYIRPQVIEGSSEVAYGFWRYDTVYRIYKYEITSIGTVTETFIRQVTPADIGSSTYSSYLNDRPILYYDPTDNSLVSTVTVDSFNQTAFKVSLDTNEIVWFSRMLYAEYRWGFMRFYHILDGEWLIFDGGLVDGTAMRIDLETGRNDIIGTDAGSDFSEANGSVWDDTTNTLYWWTHDILVDSQANASVYTTVTIAPGTIELFLSLPFPIEAGDLFTIYPGCDKTRLTCAVFFDNAENFLGAPDVPGQDSVLSYPDNKQ